MFSLIITGEIFTLRYEVSPVRRLLFIAGGLAGVGVAAFETAGAGGAHVPAFAPLVPAIPCVTLMAY